MLIVVCPVINILKGARSEDVCCSEDYSDFCLSRLFTSSRTRPVPSVRRNHASFRARDHRRRNQQDREERAAEVPAHHRPSGGNTLRSGLETTGVGINRTVKSGRQRSRHTTVRPSETRFVPDSRPPASEST
ncbi:uncharacterized protein LOC120423503 [Culex pipiens pallens]|uniref:uncharacterized protein LOC120423503 n=1 Tax=Culex pipiens pallens TaxID=42434 RepID=UPI0019545044|nr:uncharacterized protein LOC120423503 [Culex pipiens pallens]